MTISQMESWEAKKKTRNHDEQAVLDVLFKFPRGLTAWEVAAEAKLSPVPHRQDVAPRLTELVDAGLVVESGTKRMTPSGRNGEVYMLREYWEEGEKNNVQIAM